MAINREGTRRLSAPNFPFSNSFSISYWVNPTGNQKAMNGSLDEQSVGIGSMGPDLGEKAGERFGGTTEEF